MHVQETIVEEVVKDSKIQSLGNVNFDELYKNDANRDAEESPLETESEIKFIGKRLISTWNLCDEIEFLYWFEADDDDDDEDDNSKNKEELSKTDKAAIDNVLDELVDMANSQDANINASAD
ncbi:hypothetical protein Tco_0131346, partial [Tanacetum coccineum]